MLVLQKNDAAKVKFSHLNENNCAKVENAGQWRGRNQK